MVKSRKEVPVNIGSVKLLEIRTDGEFDYQVVETGAAMCCVRQRAHGSAGAFGSAYSMRRADLDRLRVIG